MGVGMPAADPAGFLDELLGVVREVMTSGVVTLTPDVSASEAVHALAHAGVTGAPVVEGDRVVGIVTLGDLMERAGAGPRSPTTGPFLRTDRALAEHRVRELMTKDVVTVRADTPVSRVALLMEELGVNRLPVLGPGDRPVGIVARDDVVRAVARAARAAAERHPGAPAIPPD